MIRNLTADAAASAAPATLVSDIFAGHGLPWPPVLRMQLINAELQLLREESEISHARIVYLERQPSWPVHVLTKVLKAIRSKIEGFYGPSRLDLGASRAGLQPAE